MTLIYSGHLGLPGFFCFSVLNKAVRARYYYRPPTIRKRRTEKIFFSSSCDVAVMGNIYSIVKSWGSIASLFSTLLFNKAPKKLLFSMYVRVVTKVISQGLRACKGRRARISSDILRRPQFFSSLPLFI